MRKLSIISLAAVSISMGLPFALSGHWWGLLACLLAGALWTYPSSYRIDQRATLGLFILAFCGIAGNFLGHSHLWSLTNFVLLLVIWDLENYTRVFQEFEKDKISRETAIVLFYAHLKRLGLIAGLAWCLGIAALNIRFQISFGVALILICFAILSLRQVARSLIQG